MSRSKILLPITDSNQGCLAKMAGPRLHEETFGYQGHFSPSSFADVTPFHSVLTFRFPLGFTFFLLSWIQWFKSFWVNKGHTAICGNSSYSILRATVSDLGLGWALISSMASSLILSFLNNVLSSQFLALFNISYRLNMTSIFSSHCTSTDSQNLRRSSFSFSISS